MDARHLQGKAAAREAEVLRRIAWGLSDREIAAQLGISIKTVEHHKTAAADRLPLHSRADIVRYALAQGWLDNDLRPEWSSVLGIVLERRLQRGQCPPPP
jgi:DNA-binding NarL/FixJ family response regulator